MSTLRFLDDSYLDKYRRRWQLEKVFQPDSLMNLSRGVDPKKSENIGLSDSASPFQPEWRDLCVLHDVCIRRQVAKVLEFGSGFSTGILAQAMVDSQKENGDWVSVHRRTPAPFTVLSFEEDKKWADVAVSRMIGSLQERVEVIVAPVEMMLFNGRYATRYRSNRVRPADLVWLDGPSQFATAAEEGWTTAFEDSMPMAADLLLIEHFFEPGAIVIVDGRTANARFLKSNFQRDWAHHHSFELDLHFFELQEEPLGPINKARLERLGLGNWLLGDFL